MPLPSLGGLATTVRHHPRYIEHLLAKKLALFSRYRWMEENTASDDAVPPPLIYKLVLTYKCNLRCAMCYEWGDAGWCHADSREAKRELDWSVVEKIFAQRVTRHPSFILIGGEPLLYSRFGDLARQLREHRCFAITCTNGMFAERMCASAEDNPYLTYLISLDGLEARNDTIRGAGVYRRVTDTIRQLKAMRRPPYIGIQFTICPENVRDIYQFCSEMVELGVDWILFNLTWFVTPREGAEYAQFMRERFGITATSQESYQRPYPLDAEEFIRQYRRVMSARWPIQISSYLKRPEDIYAYLEDGARDLSAQDNATFAHCSKQWIRMDVTPDAQVRPCVLYPDLTVGSLADNDVSAVWNGPAYADFRRMRRETMLSICRKCDALYLYDARRKVL